MLKVPLRENIVNLAGSARSQARRLGRRLLLLVFVGSQGEVLLPIPQGLALGKSDWELAVKGVFIVTAEARTEPWM